MSVPFPPPPFRGDASCESIRPGRRVVVAVACNLPDVLAVAGHRVDLRPAAVPRRGERDVTSIRGEGGTLVAALAKCDLPRLAAREVVDLDVERRSGPSRVRNLVEWRGRPRRPVRPRVVGRNTLQ